MKNLVEADSVLNRAITRLGRLHLTSTAEINEVATLQAELKHALVSLERTRAAALLYSTPTAPAPHRYADVFANALDAILIADDRARYIDVNDAACRLLEYTATELLQLGVADITPENQRHL